MVAHEPPPRSAAVHKLDELLDGLRSSSISNQQPKSENRKAVTGQGIGASTDREGCFCQGKSASLFCTAFLPFCLFSFVSQSIISFNLNFTIVSPNTRIQNTLPSAPAVSSSAPYNLYTVPIHTAANRSSRLPHERRSLRR